LCFFLERGRNPGKHLLEKNEITNQSASPPSWTFYHGGGKPQKPGNKQTTNIKPNTNKTLARAS
jgi:hypothetical protein